MHHNITIRNAVISDAEEISRVTKNAFSGYKIPVTPSAMTETLNDIINDINTKTVIVAEAKGEIIGCVRLSPDNGGLYLSRFAVDTSFQKTGIGDKLISFSENFATENSYEFIKLHTSLEILSLVRFYQSFGFEVLAFDTSRGYKRGEMLKKLKLDKK